LGDVCEEDSLRPRETGLQVGDLPPAEFDAVVHLAAIVGFPACQAVGKEVAWRYNTSAVQRVFELANQVGIQRFVFSSTYSNYGLSPDGRPVTEESPLYPQSLYAETKIAAEEYLLNSAPSAACAPIIYRFATLFGVSPRTRFDLIVNQFVLEAYTRRKIIIYQRGYARSFVHVRDICEALQLALEAPLDKLRGQVYNIGSDDYNYTKDEIVTLVQQNVPGTVIEYKDLTFGGDMRDIRVSFAKARQALGYMPRLSVEYGVREVHSMLANGMILNPLDGHYRNAQFIVQ
jgi:nucleoside-diphosphate-sugar epimerase